MIDTRFYPRANTAIALLVIYERIVLIKKNIQKKMKKVIELFGVVRKNLPVIKVYVGQLLYIIDMLDGVRDWDKPKDKE